VNDQIRVESRGLRRADRAADFAPLFAQSFHWANGQGQTNFVTARTRSGLYSPASRRLRYGRLP
jgi:hypothetical protein